jgi:hypothetical protein
MHMNILSQNQSYLLIFFPYTSSTMLARVHIACMSLLPNILHFHTKASLELLSKILLKQFADLRKRNSLDNPKPSPSCALTFSTTDVDAWVTMSLRGISLVLSKYLSFNAITYDLNESKGDMSSMLVSYLLCVLLHVQTSV